MLLRNEKMDNELLLTGYSLDLLDVCVKNCMDEKVALATMFTFNTQSLLLQVQPLVQLNHSLSQRGQSNITKRG